MTATECYHAGTDERTGACTNCGAGAPVVIAELRSQLARLVRTGSGRSGDTMARLEAAERQLEVAVEYMAWRAELGDPRAHAALKVMEPMAVKARKGR